MLEKVLTEIWGRLGRQPGGSVQKAFKSIARVCERRVLGMSMLTPAHPGHVQSSFQATTPTPFWLPGSDPTQGLCLKRASTAENNSKAPKPIQPATRTSAEMPPHPVLGDLLQSTFLFSHSFQHGHARYAVFLIGWELDRKENVAYLSIPEDWVGKTLL